MKENNLLRVISIFRYRIIWVVSSIIITVAAYFFAPAVLPHPPQPLDIFSYWGTVATIIALIITILEVVQAAKVSKTITSSIDEKVQAITNINKTALLSESSVIIDQIVDAIDANKYAESTILIRELQKRLLYSQSDLLQTGIQYGGSFVSFSRLEQKIEAYRASSASAPITKSQKGFVKGALITLKQSINDYNPVRK